MSSKGTSRLLKVPFVIVVALLTTMVGYQLIHQWPLSERAKARRHSVQLWGTQPLTGQQLSHGEVRASPGGPYRKFVFGFTDKFGQTEKVGGSFLLKSPPPQQVKVWQQQSTGEVFLPSTYDGYSSIRSKLPYYNGNVTQGWTTFVGVVFTLIALGIIWLIAALIYGPVDGRVEEMRRDRLLKEKRSATAPTS